jgi:hypothetical protein
LPIAGRQPDCARSSISPYLGSHYRFAAPRRALSLFAKVSKSAFLPLPSRLENSSGSTDGIGYGLGRRLVRRLQDRRRNLNRTLQFSHFVSPTFTNRWDPRQSSTSHFIRCQEASFCAIGATGNQGLTFRKFADDGLSDASKAAVVSSLVRVSLLADCSGIAVLGHDSRCHTRNHAVER